MKALRHLNLILLLSFVTSCASLLPVNNHYEKAGTLQKGNVELSGHVTRYNVNHFDRTEKSNDNYGFRVGYGITDRFDLKLRYEKLAFTKNFDDRLAKADYISLVPKLALVPDHLSLLLPLSTYQSLYKTEDLTYKRRITSIAPQLVFTMTNTKQTLDLSLSAKADYIFQNTYDHEANIYMGATLGAGISQDLRKWAIRPEIGLSSSGVDARYFSYGIGFQMMIPKKKKK